MNLIWQDIPVFNYLWCVNDIMKREKMPSLLQQSTLFAECLRENARLLAVDAANGCATETSNLIRQRVDRLKDVSDFFTHLFCRFIHLKSL